VSDSELPQTNTPYETANAPADKTTDVVLLIQNEKGAMKINYGTGAKVYIRFEAQS